MKKASWKKVLKAVGSLSALAAGALAVATCAREDRAFEKPAVAIHASADPAVIARGEYLVRGPAHCADCHGAADEREAQELGVPVALSGGRAFRLPVGTFYVPNITPDEKTGLGRHTDEDLARALRYGVRPDGTALLPFMPFANLSDEDLTAVVSYLRAQPPVSHAVAKHEPSVVGRVMKAWVLEPRGPSEPVRASIARGPTPEYGRYLAHSVANCVGCHTKIDLRTGAFAAPIFSGGAVHDSSTDPGKKFVAPNLTPDPKWGWISSWSEDAFVTRLHGGRIHEGSPMPWHAFARMSDDDLRALYRYLKTVPAVPGGPDPAERKVMLSTAER